jgi:hypothetical protein
MKMSAVATPPAQFQFKNFKLLQIDYFAIFFLKRIERVV